MASIYNIADWVNTYGGYKVNDIVKDGSDFWYCIKGHSSANSKKPEVGSIYWGGRQEIRVAGQDTVQPYFFWSPSYSLAVTQEPKILSVQFGDGYEQRLPDGINSDMLQFTITFDKRTTKETTAIVHFLASKRAVSPFYFRVPEPYGITKKFVCATWSSTLVFDDHHSISASFIEKS